MQYLSKCLFDFLPVSVSSVTDADPLLSSIITLHVYIPSSPSIKFCIWRLLVYMLPLEVVGLMVTLLSFAIMSSPGPIHLIITELDSTPLTVLTVHWIVWGLPTIAPCMGPDGDRVTRGVGTVQETTMTKVA